jgi:hypothetical protein
MSNSEIRPIQPHFEEEKKELKSLKSNSDGGVVSDSLSNIIPNSPIDRSAAHAEAYEKETKNIFTDISKLDVSNNKLNRTDIPKSNNYNEDMLSSTIPFILERRRSKYSSLTEKDDSMIKPKGKIFRIGKSKQKPHEDVPKVTLQRRLKAAFEKDKIVNMDHREKGESEGVFRRDKNNVTSGMIKLENKISKR